MLHPRDDSIPSPDLVIVVGMHRSGTSAIARGLATLGCQLGESLIGAIPEVNAKGFWEDIEINTFNQRLLEESESDWFFTEALPAEFFSAPGIHKKRQEARQILSSKLHQHRPFAVKDPRISVLLPFWQPVFRDLGLRVAYVHAYRNPLEVAQSLLLRDHFPIERGLLLWLIYHQEALRYTLSEPHVFVNFPRMLDHPEEQLSRISRALGLAPFEATSPESLEYTQEFLESKLRHMRCDDRWLEEPGQLPDPWRSLYRYFEERSQDREAQPPIPLLERFAFDTKIHRTIIQDLEVRLRESKANIQDLEARLRESKSNLDATKVNLEETEARLAGLHAERNADQMARQDLERVIREQQEQVQALQHEIDVFLHSTSWQITKPLRVGKTWLRELLLHPVSSQKRLLRWTFDHILPGSAKRPHRQGTSKTGRSSENVSHLASTQVIEPVRCRKRDLPFSSPIRMIALYLPQFHEIPENNQWWGQGFTEWTNVKPAQPYFPGHYQPHVPLHGYYDLTNPEILPSQAQLAHRYGIEGFCFYFYWFHRRRLLETPLQMLLQNPEWDVPFCLCWANENWTRRWDGLDQEVLIAQEYSEEDDLALIAHLKSYLEDPRYIRIDGKPLLLIYRPDLLPDAAATVARWRDSCRQSGVGEIFVSYTQSFECRNPSIYGMDAAVEFPPNNSAPPPIDIRELEAYSTFHGNVYDWNIFPQRSRKYQDPGYLLFRGINPGWDNTARRKERATIFLNANPLGYQEWAKNACDDTFSRISQQQERIVFVNAWNEWAEGAHLEPDIKYGCAYLEATHMAQLRSAIQNKELPSRGQRVAVVIHAFYPEILLDMVPKLQDLPADEADIWVTTTEDKRQEVAKVMNSLSSNVYIIVRPNRGRDVLPFLHVLDALVKNESYGYVLKLHTKKSKHRDDGDKWRDSFYEALLPWPNILSYRDRMVSDPALGMIAPKEHIVPMSFFWGSNARHVLPIASRLGVEEKSFTEIEFVAGTMFFCRMEALLPLWLLDLQETDFEEECGQIDGTMAHAVERALGISCYAVGLRVEM